MILFLAGAAPAILAKSLHAHPPPGMATADLQAGALLMYYGGDPVEAALAVVPAVEWYRAAGRNRTRVVRRNAAAGHCAERGGRTLRAPGRRRCGAALAPLAYHDTPGPSEGR
ncbi:hypothetical protein ACWPOB_05425 [Rhodococcus sp. 2H158]